MNNASYSDAPELRKAGRKAKWPVILLVLLVIAAAGYAVYTRAIVGRLTTDVTTEVETAEDGTALIYGKLNGFAGLKDVSYTVDEDVLTLEVLCTWPVFDREKEFCILFENDSFSEVMEVDIFDGHSRLVVWTNE